MAAYPLLGRGRGGLRTRSGIKNIDLNEQTHPLPPPKEGISSFNYTLVLDIYPVFSKNIVLCIRLA
jgi:hypothetical protein